MPLDSNEKPHQGASTALWLLNTTWPGDPALVILAIVAWRAVLKLLAVSCAPVNAVVVNLQIWSRGHQAIIAQVPE